MKTQEFKMEDNIRIYGIQSRTHTVIMGIPDITLLTDDENYVLKNETGVAFPESSKLRIREGARIAEYDERYENPVLITSDLIQLSTNGKGTAVTLVKEGKIWEDYEPCYSLILRFQMPVREYDQFASRVETTIKDAKARNQSALETHLRKADTKINEYLVGHQKALARLLAEREHFTAPVNVPSAREMLFEMLDADEKKRKKG